MYLLWVSYQDLARLPNSSAHRERRVGHSAGRAVTLNSSMVQWATIALLCDSGRPLRNPSLDLTGRWHARVGHAGEEEFQLSTLRAGRLLRWPGFEELLFAVNKGVDIGGGQFDVVTVGDCIGRTRLHAIAAKNTSGVVDVVNLGVAVAGRNAVGFGVFSGFDINTICRTGRRAQEASHAFFKAVFVPLQNVNSAITRLNARRDIGIRFRCGLPKHGAQGHAEALVESQKRFADFSHDRWHRIDFIRVLLDRQFSEPRSLSKPCGSLVLQSISGMQTNPTQRNIAILLEETPAVSRSTYPFR